MRDVPVRARATLPWRAVRARTWPGGWILASQRSEVIVVDRALRTLSTDVLPGWTFDPRYLDVHHRDDGLVWTAEAKDRAITLAVQGREAQLDDPFGGSAVMLFAHPDPARVIVWIAAGQDGQAAFLATDRDGAIAVDELPPRDRLPPEFVPSGDAYLAAGDDRIEVRAWPSAEVVSTVWWPVDEDDDDDDPDQLAGDEVIALPGGYAAWSSREGRLMLVDLPGAQIVDELAVAPDFQYAVRRGDDVLTVHADRTLILTSARAWVP